MVGFSPQAPFRHRLGGDPPPYRVTFPIPLRVLGLLSGGEDETKSFKDKFRANFPFKIVLKNFCFATSAFVSSVLPGGVRRGPPFQPFCLMRLEIFMF